MAALTAFYNNFDPHGSQFNYINTENAIHCSFGDTAHLFGSPGMSWCGSAGATSFFALDHAAILNDLGAVEYPTEEELLLGGDASEFLQQFNGHQKTLEVADERYSFEHQELNQIGNQVHYQQQRFHEEQLHLADSPQTCASDESGLTTQDVVTVAVESDYFDEVEIKHEPPPLNNKRLEKIEYPDESIEAAEVSVDLIQNRRPFQCGQAGCNKTFKNPQTMKMHHKTHYTDGSAVDGLLPTLTTSSNTFNNSNTNSSNNNNNNSKAGQNKKIPSRCPKCRKTFVGLYELRRHYGRKHSEGEKPFGCRKCNKKFYIEVDVRDHEKLCGEPIECKCGLKFAFKCNLVAHRKVHPECQQELPHHGHHRNRFSTKSSKTSQNPKSSKSCKSTTTSDGESSCKRRRVDISASNSESDSITSRYLASYAVPAPDFQWLPEAKAPRYDFTAALEFASDESGNVWSSGHNMHYPSVVDFVNLPSPSSFSGFESLGGHSQSFQPRKQELMAQSTTSLDLLHLHPKFNALHGTMVHLNQVSSDLLPFVCHFSSEIA